MYFIRVEIGSLKMHLLTGNNNNNNHNQSRKYWQLD